MTKFYFIFYFTFFKFIKLRKTLEMPLIPDVWSRVDLNRRER